MLQTDVNELGGQGHKYGGAGDNRGNTLIKATQKRRITVSGIDIKS